MHCTDIEMACNFLESSLSRSERIVFGESASTPGSSHSLGKGKIAMETNPDADCPIQKGPQVAHHARSGQEKHFVYLFWHGTKLDLYARRLTVFCAFSRALRKRWIDLVSVAMVEGRRRAIETEKHYWAKHQAAVRVTPSGKITDSQGKELMPIAINAVTKQA